MTGWSALAWLLAGLSLWVYPDPPMIRRASRDGSGEPRVSDVPRVRGVSDLPRVRAVSLSPAMRRAAIAALGVVALGVLAGVPWWSVAAATAVVGLAASRIPVRATPAERMAARHLLAVHADLLGACLDAGMAIGPALRAVSEQLDPDGGRAVDRRVVLADASGRPADAWQALDSVATLLALGAGPELSWQPAERIPDLAGLAAAARRSAAGGIAMADAVREHAVGLRAANALAAERTASRAGVAMTAPLGLCFLPAFLCLGLAPVVVGLLGTLGIF